MTLPSALPSAIAAHARLRLLSDLCLLAVAALWGGSYGVMKTALGFYPVLGLLMLRFGLTFILLLPALRGLRGLRAGTSVRMAGLGLLLLAVFLCETYGVLMTQAARAAFLISLCVALTPLAEWALLRRQPGAREWGAVGLSLAGAALLAGDGGGGAQPGDGLILAAAGLRALLVCLTRRWLAPDVSDANAAGRAPAALTITAVQSGVVLLGSVALASVQGAWPALVAQWPSPAGQGVFWACVGYLVLGCTLFAFWAQNFGLQHSPPTRVSLLMGSEPLFGALFAVALLGERIGPAAWTGGALMVAAACLATGRWPLPAISGAWLRRRVRPASR